MSHLRLAASDSLFDGGWSHIAVASPGSVVFTAGAAPIDADGATVAPGDVQAQARQCMANLEVALRDAGAALSDVAKVTVYVAESLQADLSVAWDAVAAAFGDHKPVASLLGVTVLAHDEQLVEIEAVAALPPAS
ncbi:RidA family protein [Williamsia deligens]|uniref:RidA family protein n=1 Tax=Williamsia deligens TaxID=321325 RepID=A0ABW3G6P1_9NOCA|nr:Rid family hydrolase [Williamsia deligens]MCP2193081.1 Enamine deaminase RidA, house cleaning of reactive enamine intermediates, YjgF/YER057c/UK114 family [Williamsia deligens]